MEIQFCGPGLAEARRDCPGTAAGESGVHPQLFPVFVVKMD